MKGEQGLAWLVGVVWLFGVALLVLMGLSTAAAILFIGLAFYVIILYVFFHAPPAMFNVKSRPVRKRANRNAGKTYRVQAGNTRKALHDKR